jgi:ribosomal protein S18 acetylase RimI-like enzyme
MEIITARKEHLEEILEMLSAVVDFMSDVGNRQWGRDYPTREMFIKHISDQVLWIMIENNRIICTIVITEDQDKEYADVPWVDSTGKAMVVHRLAVNPEFQRKGLANKMMDFAEDLARERGFTSIRLDTYSENKITPVFFKKRGYEFRGRIHFPQRDLPYYCFEKIL